MSKAVKLSIKPTYDFQLIGIVSSEPIYRLSYLINSSLNIHLKETEPAKIYHQKLNIYQAFEVFSFFNEEIEESYELIHNKGGQGILIEEQKQVDYWLKYENSTKSLTELIELLKSIKNTSLAFEVKPDSLKSKNKFIFSKPED